MQKIDLFAYSKQILQQLPRGLFLNSAARSRINTMTIGWANLGWQWGLPVFTVMVRESRYTKELLEANPVFTVSVPLDESFAKALAFCGTHSGRACADKNKFVAAGLTSAAAQSVECAIVKGCGLQIECRVVDKQVMALSRFDGALAAKWYADDDWHTYYTGVVTAAYLE